jgi:hypothetical protein
MRVTVRRAEDELVVRYVDGRCAAVIVVQDIAAWVCTSHPYNLARAESIVVRDGVYVSVGDCGKGQEANVCVVDAGRAG